MGKVMLEGYKCERCGHTWVPRESTEGMPVICPRCKSPYWNKARKIDLRPEAEKVIRKYTRNRRGMEIEG